MSSDEACPICTMTDLLAVDDGFECATCGHEWRPADDGELEVRDANGTLLANGDTVVLVQGVPLNGKANAFKAGMKVKGIRLVSGDHEIDCKVEGRAILLKARFVKKA
jgi:protein PhnA